MSPASSTPVGPPPMITMVCNASRCRRILAPLGLFKGLQKAMADFQRVVERLEPGGVGLPLVVAEVGVTRPGGDHQVKSYDSRRVPLSRITRRDSTSIPVTSPIKTRTLSCLRRIQRMGTAMSDGARVAVATW